MTESEFIEAHSGLAIWIANKLRNRFPKCDQDFAESFAFEGLLKAARTWKPEGKANPATWTGYCVRGAVIDGADKLKGQHQRRNKQMMRHDLEDVHVVPEPDDREEVFAELKAAYLSVIAEVDISPRYRRALDARILQGMTTGQVAKDWGVRPNIAAMAVLQAKQIVQKHLAGIRPKRIRYKSGRTTSQKAV